MLIALVPVFNEEENVIKVLDKLEKQVDCIVIINDGSFDKTDCLISYWIKDKKDTSYLSFKKNKGMASAIRWGFNFIKEQYKKAKFAGDDVIVMLDADGQHNPDKISSMYAYFNENRLDLLIARRDLSIYPRDRVIGNRLLSLFASCLGGFKFVDIECGFKILKVSFMLDVLNYYIGFRYSCASEIGLIASSLGYCVDNKYPIEIYRYRKRGPGFVDLFINLLFCSLIVLKIKCRRNRTAVINLPLSKDLV